MDYPTSDYYRDKAKDSQQQAVYLMWLVLITVCLGVGWYIGGRLMHKCPEPQQPRLMSIIELQEAVVAEPDGIPGPNTIAKWEQAYANQEAAKFFTPSGGKE